MVDFNLKTGVLTVTPDDFSQSCEELFEIAERRNPKRSFLFVSKVLGRHIPVSPTVVRETFKKLADKIPRDLPGPILFIGMAETAVGLAAGVHQEYIKHRSDTCLLTSTRHPVNGDLLCEFKEEHSHATDHLIYWPSDDHLLDRVSGAVSLVLIDDEATTGNTFANLLSALRQSEHSFEKIERVCAVTLTDWSSNALATRTELPVDSVSLMNGKWLWEPNVDAELPVMPMVNVTKQGSAQVSDRQDWGRLGADCHELNIGTDLTVKKGERILVLGTGEFVWQPFLLAERLMEMGAESYYSSTTRSPISVGHGIKTAISFADNYGLGIPNFTYNVFPEQYDRIILCSETPLSACDPDLLAALNNPEFIYYE